MSGSTMSTRMGGQEPFNVEEDHQAIAEVSSQDDATSSTLISRGTHVSHATVPTTAEFVIRGGNAQDGEAVHTQGPAAGGAVGGMLPPGDPLTTVAIGAQFATQLQQIVPAFDPHEQYSQHLIRMAELRDAFLELSVNIPDEILQRAENVNYNMTIPDTVREQFAALHPHEDPRMLWLRAEDIWNEISARLRPRLSDSVVPQGWDELEQLPFTG